MTLYVLVSFEVRDRHRRELLDCDLYLSEADATAQMEKDVQTAITVYSKTSATKEYPIKSVGTEQWHDVNIPGECSETGRPIGITWEIRKCEVQE